MFAEKSLEDFTRELASRSPVPGGGGAAALAGALGAALGEMVGALTVGKKRYAAVEAEVRSLMERAETLRAQLLDCVEKDAAAFAPLSRAYAIPRGEPGREEEMERCLALAAQPPMEILELCCQAVELHRALAEKGSALVVSDAGCGAALCRGTMYAAALNVRVNTRAMRDRERAAALNRRVDELLERYGAAAEEVCREVYERLG